MILYLLSVRNEALIPIITSNFMTHTHTMPFFSIVLLRVCFGQGRFISYIIPPNRICSIIYLVSQKSVY